MLRYLANVVTLDLDEKVCNGCGICVTVCPHRVFEMAGRRADGTVDSGCQECGACLDSEDCLFETSSRKAVVIDRDACIECGACALNCPVDAIRVQTGSGCATAVLLGALGRQGDCSAASGCAPAGEATCSGSEASPAEVDRR